MKLFIQYLQDIERAQIGKKWPENAPKKVHFSKFSSNLVAMDTTTLKNLAPPPFEIL